MISYSVGIMCYPYNDSLDIKKVHPKKQPQHLTVTAYYPSNLTSSMTPLSTILISIIESLKKTINGTLTRGRTDKKLTSTLVIQTFLSFDLPDIF